MSVIALTGSAPDTVKVTSVKKEATINSVMLSWKADAKNAEYHIYDGTTLIATATVNFVTIIGLGAGVDYEYRIVSWSTDGIVWSVFDPADIKINNGATTTLELLSGAYEKLGTLNAVGQTIFFKADVIFSDGSLTNWTRGSKFKL